MYELLTLIVNLAKLDASIQFMCVAFFFHKYFYAYMYNFSYKLMHKYALITVTIVNVHLTVDFGGKRRMIYIRTFFLLHEFFLFMNFGS